MVIQQHNGLYAILNDYRGLDKHSLTRREAEAVMTERLGPDAAARELRSADFHARGPYGNPPHHHASAFLSMFNPGHEYRQLFSSAQAVVDAMARDSQSPPPAKETVSRLWFGRRKLATVSHNRDKMTIRLRHKTTSLSLAVEDAIFLRARLSEFIALSQGADNADAADAIDAVEATQF